MALSECSSIANEFERDQLTPSKEQRAKEARTERAFAFSEAKVRRRSLNVMLTVPSSSCRS